MFAGCLGAESCELQLLLPHCVKAQLLFTCLTFFRLTVLRHSGSFWSFVCLVVFVSPHCVKTQRLVLCLVCSVCLIFFFCCERLSASMARSLRLELYLYTAVDSVCSVCLTVLRHSGLVDCFRDLFCCLPLCVKAQRLVLFGFCLIPS